MNIIVMMFLPVRKNNTSLYRYMVRKGGAVDYENDISAKEKIQIQSTWIQSENENGKWKKSSFCKESKRKKSVIRVNHKIGLLQDDSARNPGALQFMMKII